MGAISGDIFIGLIFGFIGAVVIFIAFIFSLVGLALLAWWVFGNYFSETVHVTVVGIRTRAKDTVLDEGEYKKTKPYAMYSPILSLGTISASQNWIAEKWIPGSKMAVLKTSDPSVFQEKPSLWILFVAFAIIAAAGSVMYNVEKDIYSFAFLALLIANPLLKILRSGTIAKIINFFFKTSQEEKKKQFAASRFAFMKRKKDERAEEKKEWRKLPEQEVFEILKQQYKNFVRGTVPFLFLVCGSLVFAAYYLWLRTSENYINQAPYDANLPPITHLDAPQFFFAIFLGLMAVFIFLKIIIKTLRLRDKINSPRIIF